MKAMMSQLVMSGDVNGVNRLFGGKLMQWIDITGAIACRRQANGNHCVLHVADSMQFMEAIKINDIVTIEAKVTWTGRTSVECKVESSVEDNHGARKLVNVAYMLYVAVDESGNPIPVEPFVPATEEERAEWLAAEERRKTRIARERSVKKLQPPVEDAATQ
ncbi:MAG: acyl-CoA thioesterase [Clostridia bacterium]|nr:acyl-CoA thioesterase [Clostridia bacterium]